MSQKIICLYHAYCMDGLFAAWSVYQYHGVSVQFIPMTYSQEDVDRLSPEMFKDAIVYFVDFCLSPDVTFSLMEQAMSVVILDHHKTAIEKWADRAVPGMYQLVFDTERSGAGLAWEHFNPGDDIPHAIKLVEDRDLWVFKFGDDAKHHHAYIKAQSWSNDAPSLALSRHITRMADRLYPAEVLREGKSIVTTRQAIINGIIDTSTTMVYLEGHHVPMVPMPGELASEAAEQLRLRYPEAAFTITYCDSVGVRTFSLRSTPEGADVRVIAEQYGGGGHRNAAGFTEKMPPLLPTEPLPY